MRQIVQRFAATDLNPERISKFAESSNETAGGEFYLRMAIKENLNLLLGASSLVLLIMIAHLLPGRTQS